MGFETTNLRLIMSCFEDKLYVGLDVSDKMTHICAVDQSGKMTRRGVCATDPSEVVQTLKRHWDSNDNT